METIIAVTGHRPGKLNKEYDYIGPYSDYLRKRIKKVLLDRQPVRTISGMALGVDTIFAQVSLELKIPLLAAIPFIGQESQWPQKSQDLYNRILNHPLVTSHIVCEGPYNSAKMQIRNEFMVDEASLLIACWNGTLGGTMNCVRYAEKQKNKEIFYINPEGWKIDQAQIDPQPQLF